MALFAHIGPSDIGGGQGYCISLPVSLQEFIMIWVISSFTFKKRMRSFPMEFFFNTWIAKYFWTYDLNDKVSSHPKMLKSNGLKHK